MASPPAAEEVAALRRCLLRGLPLDPLPPPSGPSPGVPHAPRRRPGLTEAEERLAVANALRYFPARLHTLLAAEFALELRHEGHIYMRRFRPTEYRMRAFPLEAYPQAARCPEAACLALNVMNNLDAAVAQFPEELVTYGGCGSVFSNWAQYHLVMRYLAEMTREQTLVLSSGHPAGLFPSSPAAPRVVITNGMVVPNYSRPADYDRMYALGVSQYGQMTAGSMCYIGPAGIVHGTTITILNAARKYLGLKAGESLGGLVYVSSGLGGMSGAQGKAAVICGAVTVLAEVDRDALEKRHAQGWVQEVADSLDDCVRRLREARAARRPLSLAYHGNAVDLWERLADEADRTGERLADLGSDQTSLHIPYTGGYYPAGVTVDESRRLMVEEPGRFRELVHESLRRQVGAINRLAARGLRFWDYGNGFLLESRRAGAEVQAPGEGPESTRFRYPSYVQDIMGDVFSLGFGPFRWVCSSGSPEDLAETDRIAAGVIRRMRDAAPPAPVDAQLRDNLRWIEEAGANNLVVGSQARILYADAEGRAAIAGAFNEAIAAGRLSAPVILSRDHHDVSGTDSPFRETSNIADGSQYCADMAVHTFVGNAMRGATWVALHNGGGVGWGEAINGGFGLVLDGTPEAGRRAASMLHWDVCNGVARRSWAGNDNADLAARRAQEAASGLRLTMAEHADPDVVARALDGAASD